MGNMDVPSQRGPIKCPIGTYEFGANVINDKVRAQLLLSQCNERGPRFARPGRAQAASTAVGGGVLAPGQGACRLQRATDAYPPAARSSSSSAASQQTRGSPAGSSGRPAAPAPALQWCWQQQQPAPVQSTAAGSQ
jgi:hypothetical protein